MNGLQTLKWDSDFFKKKVGEVDFRISPIPHLSQLKKAIEAKYSLVYIKSESRLDISQISGWRIFDSGGAVELKKQLQVEACSRTPRPDLGEELSVIDNIDSISDDLLYLCGAKSRFYRDPDIRIKDFQALYREWLSADLENPQCRVVGHKLGNEIISFGSIRYSRYTGNISLIAVSQEHQGKGLGKHLLKWMEGEAQRAGLDDICVKTQVINNDII